MGSLTSLCMMHSNDSHQCPILAADLFWDRKWIAYLYPSLTSRPCLDGFFIFCPIIKNNKVSCQYGTLMWIIAVKKTYYSALHSYITFHEKLKKKLIHDDEKLDLKISCIVYKTLYILPTIKWSFLLFFKTRQQYRK